MKKYLLALSLVAALVVRAETTTINISEAAGLQKELAADDVLVINVSGNTDQSSVDWSGIIGTGTIKFQGSGVVTLPNSAECRFAETLSLDSSTTLKLGSMWRTTGAGSIQTPFKVRNLSGSASFNRYSSTARNHLRTEQTKVTEWSGVLENSYSYNGTQYGVYIWVASDGVEPSKDKALIVSGNQTSAQTLRIESTGCVVLKGQWKGTIENNGLLVIAPGVDRSQFTVTGSGRTELQQANEVIVIVPSDLKEMWEKEFATAYAEIHPGYTCSVVSTSDIYTTYPYVATNTNGAPRNPAESIHAFIKNANLKDGNEYFILGGPWVDIDDIATNKVMKLATGETLTLENTVPGVKVSPDDRYRSPTDMYYACFDSKNTYAWDADGNGKYLESTEFQDSDMTASVIVTRIPLVTYASWKHEDGTLYTQSELLTAYVEKLRRGLAAGFDGFNRYGIYGYLINESGVQKLGGANEAWVERKETAFYDNGYNMFDPARGSDDFWLVEGVSRRRIRDQIASVRPVDDVNGFLEATFNKKHHNADEARAAWKTENYALRFYYAHGARGGGHGFGMEDYINKGCGLTLFDDCAGPCSTGKIEFDSNGVYQMNYAIGCVMSPFGGSLTTINNCDFGIADLNNYWKGFQPNDSWRYANNYLVGFVQKNMNVGEAWKDNVTDFVTNYKFNKSGLDTWMLAEEMLLGDPLVKLPAIEENLNFGIDGVTYTGLPNKTDAVVSMNIDSDDMLQIRTPEVPFKVMNGLKTNGQMLSLCTGEGGIGGEGVVFTGEKGMLYLIGDEPFYVAGVTNANVVVEGKGAILDYDNFDATGPSSLVIKTGTEATIRSSTRGCFSKLYDSESGDTRLYVPINGQLHLATYDAFGDTKGKVVALPGSKLVIDANPLYHNGKDQGESLNAEIKFMHDSSTLDISVAKGGYFTPAEALMGDDRVTYSVDARDGLGGTVTVPNKAKLTLKELPLSKISTLTVESGATLVIPEGKTLDDLLSSGTATLKSGAKIVCGAETTTLSEDKTVDGSKYVTKYYYTSDTTDWTNSVKMSLEPNGVADTLPTADGEVVFAKGTTFPAAEEDNLYIHDNGLCKSIHVTDSTTLKLGAESGQKWNLRSGFKVTVDEGSTLILRGWGNGGQKETNPAKVADDVVFDGDGVVTIDVNDAPICSWGNVSGTATISLPVGVTINCSGTISNDIVVPEGYKLKTTTEGATTTYVAEEDVEPPTEVIRQWSDTTGISHDSSSPMVLFTGITLDDLMSDRYTLVGEIGGAWIKGGNYNITADMAVFGEKSGNEVNVQLQAKDSDSSFTGVKFVNLKLVEDGATIRAYQYGQGNKRSVTYEGYGVFITSSDVVVADTGYILKFAVAWRRYVIEDAQTWDALPTDFRTGDSIEVAQDGELTLTFAMEQPVIGSGRVVTTVAPSDVLKNSLKQATWTGTFVLTGLDTASADMKQFNPSNYGNSKSCVELCNCTCYFPNGGSTDVPLKLTDSVSVSDGFRGATFTIRKLLGTGSLIGGKSLQSEMYIDIEDASAFYGQIALSDAGNKIVVKLPSTSPSALKANGLLSYTINADGTVSGIEVTEKAKPTIGALTLGDSATVTIAAPIAGLTYALKSAATLDAEAWEADASTKAESSKPLTLEAKPSDTTSRFYKVEVSF